MIALHLAHKVLKGGWLAEFPVKVFNMDQFQKSPNIIKNLPDSH